MGGGGPLKTPAPPWELLRGGRRSGLSRQGRRRCSDDICAVGYAMHLGLNCFYVLTFDPFHFLDMDLEDCFEFYRSNNSLFGKENL